MGNDDESDFDAKLDLLQRYETMVQTQIETLNGIDDKAAYISRLVGILIGLILTSVSIIVGTDQFQFSVSSTGALFLIFLGSLGLFSALIYAIITYLSSKFRYGPTSALGTWLIQNPPVDDSTDEFYQDTMLQGYSDAIRDNRKVVIANSKRFERCLTSLVIGVLYLLGGAVLVVLPNHIYISGIVILGISGAALLIGKYILREEYLTLEREHPDND